MTKNTVLFVVEHFLLIPPEKRTLRNRVWRYTYDIRVATEVCRIYYETHLDVTLATLRGASFADALETRFDQENLPGNVVWASSGEALREYIEHGPVFRSYHNLDSVDLGPLSERVMDSAVFDPLRS